MGLIYDLLVVLMCLSSMICFNKFLGFNFFLVLIIGLFIETLLLTVLDPFDESSRKGPGWVE